MQQPDISRSSRTSSEIRVEPPSQLQVPAASPSSSATAGMPASLHDSNDASISHPSDDVRFRLLVERSIEGIALLDVTGHAIYVNPAMEAILGYPAEEYKAIDSKRIEHPDDAETIADFGARLVASPGVPLQARYRRRHRDGDWRWLDVTATNLLQDPQVAAVAVHFRDITAEIQAEAERAQLEASVRASERRFRAVFDQAAIGIVMSTLSGGFAQVNARYCQMLGYSQDEILSHSFRLFTHPDDLEISEQYLRQLLMGEIFSYALEKRYLRKDGSILWAALHTTLMTDETGQPDYVLSIIEDITERRRLEDEREQMLSIVGHELKMPLTAMKARTQLVARQTQQGKPLNVVHLQHIEREITRLDRLVNDLNDASRVGTGLLELHPQQTELLGLCGVEVEAQIEATGRPVALLTPDEPIPVLVDPLRLRQVIGNLLSNALKYSPTETPVEVRVVREPQRSGLAANGTAQPQMVRVLVRDEGPGIAPGALPHLFERFYRVPGVTVQHGSGVGLGLGLYLSRSLIERMGGAMGVESKQGKGTTFWFTVPVSQPEAEHAAGGTH